MVPIEALQTNISDLLDIDYLYILYWKSWLPDEFIPGVLRLPRDEQTGVPIKIY
jgi:hypothetical protein